MEDACLEVVVTPGARTSEIVGRYGDAWKVRVAAAPERGRANDAVVDLFARALDVPRSALRVVAGRATRRKTISVAGVSRAEVEARLASSP